MKVPGVAALLPILLAAAPAPPRDWKAALRGDAQALHDDVARNHPGPVNALDPTFARRNDEGLRVALARSARVRDHAGYLFAMRGYIAAFEDGHMQLGTNYTSPIEPRWPGFLTGFTADGRQIVMTRADVAPVPLGAELIACDGRPAARVAERLVGDFWGRWTLAAQRMARGGSVFADLGNPFVPRPVRCTFRIAGERTPRAVTLAWQALPSPDLDRRLGEARRRAHPPIGATTLGDGTRWLTLSGFDSDPEGADAKALVPLIEMMKRDRAAIAAAPRIVLDLRGNNGGSSDWSRRIATVLWGKAAVESVATGSRWVDWRASADNVAAIKGYRDRFARSADASPEARGWAERTLAGLSAALAAGRTLWREPPDTPATAPTPDASLVTPLAGQVVMVTDWGCASACLDAADLWLALGAVHVGQQTSADALYMEIREGTLPSGLAIAAVPMKVYRGRPRGNNVPLTPLHRYDGDMRDTAALQTWVLSLR